VTPTLLAAGTDAVGVSTLLPLLIAIPLVSAAILLLVGKRGDSWGHWLGLLAPVVSFVLAVAMFFQMHGRAADARAVNVHMWDWIPVAGYQVKAGLLLDQLSVCFVLLILGVGSLIHMYSVGYMSHDPRRRRFFAYLNLFVAAMLLLVLANDYLLVFVGWEGVGLASYLLIGFWLYKPAAAVAAKKAFIVNRVGDVGMALSVMTMIAVFGTSAFSGVFAGAGKMTHTTATLLGLLLLLAACGKSAQFPLQSWLLDAMEGPTPVSALIHAATMVTAGVYLVVRSHAIFEMSAFAGNAVVVIGCITLLFGAIIGCAKDDIKKALAGSTMSQIGYMMLAAGIGPAGYAFAIFHLVTHGFFKANMFLGAGSVMHGMDDDVNMRHYGALMRAMPITFATFLFGYLAIIGIPPFAGYFSKDKIIEAAFAHNTLAGIAALLGAGITAFYMTRVMLMTFVGRKRWRAEQHPHESPWSMTVPLIVLGALSLVGGFTLAYLGGGITGWLEPLVGTTQEHSPISAGLLLALTLVLVLLGVAVAVLLFGRGEIPETAPTKVSFVTHAARADLYGDAVNHAVFVAPGYKLTDDLVTFDDKIVDGGGSGFAAVIGGLSSVGRRLQNGYVRTYALTMFAGAAVVTLSLLLVRLS
jgi:NADH-quinone oxidoreductase subunit L